MGLNYLQFRKVYPHIKGRVLSLGYPDLVLTSDQFTEITGKTCTETTDHGSWHSVIYPLPETIHAFSLLGSSLEYIDIHSSRGGEKVIDLNYPQTLDKFDLVIDPGTLEHCFNIGQALVNVASAVKVGGFIYHGSPLTMINHGFYNLCPTLFNDFYIQNGFEVEISVNMRNAKEEAIPIEHYVHRFGCIPECSLLVIAKRISEKEITYPIQTKYRENPNLTFEAK